ncbi:uncharacterized protein LOC114329271 isoform X4 [Diabrotica virgifera virgifera]|uniref:Uncharacterized protein n=1 Tax=Diabrotica virgifera virgifera TaxID=50390 RepID=A0ABM5KRF8_DIAVI|nr:uncharacterized protein LOC114329271 isoform X4 [Diabrotica virgifera virgifera]
MLAAKVVLLLGLALFASAGQDLDKGMEIVKCAQRVMSVGVPELGVPPHAPFVAIRNVSWTGSIGVASTHIELNTNKWYGLADWDISAKQINDDSDYEAVFDYTTYWPSFRIVGNYEATVKELFLTQHYKGTYNITMIKPKWTGRISAQKVPTVLTPKPIVDSFTVDWHVADIKCKITGMGIIGDTYALAIQEGIETALNHGLIGNAVGDFLKMRFNTVWYPTGKIWQMMDWCNGGSTDAPTTAAPYTHAPSTAAPYTDAPSTAAPSTAAPSTAAPSTAAPYTDAPSTAAPSTAAPSTAAPSTAAPSTAAPYTDAPSTAAP